MMIEAKNLSCIRSHKQLFSELSFSLDSGQLLLVEGENGSGKSTLLRILAGLRRPDEGELFWNKKPLVSALSDYSKQMTWVSHRNGIKESLTGRENLHAHAALSQIDARNIDEALRETGLKAHSNRLVQQYSAGMKRRLSLSRLLIKRAKLWILDEPQASLDKEGIALFERIASDHLLQNGMIIMSSHHDVQLGKHSVVKLNLQS